MQNLLNKDQTKNNVESWIKQKMENKGIYVITYVNKGDKPDTIFDLTTYFSLTDDIRSIKLENAFAYAWALI